MTDDDPVERAKALLREEARRHEAKKKSGGPGVRAPFDNVFGTGSILWNRYLRPFWNVFGWPVRKYWHLMLWVFRRLSQQDGTYKKARGAAAIFGLSIFTFFIGFHLIFSAIPIAGRFAYDALAINTMSRSEVLIFGQPNSVEGRPGELVVYACKRYPCEAQFDSVEFRIRDSVYLDVVSYVRYFQPHYPGELAGAFVSEENGCKVRYYGRRIKLLGLYPQITHAVCQPINGSNVDAVLEMVADVELR